MKIKKFTAVILSCILALGVFASCGKKETEETTTTETTTAAPDYTVWREAYSDYLMTIFAGSETLVGYEYEIDDCRFSLVDFNGDDIPELLISEGEYSSSKVNFYTYDGYEVVYAGAAGANGNVNYDLQTGIIFSQSIIEDGEKYQETSTSYIFDGRKISTQWQGCTVTEDESLVPVDYTADYGDAVTYYSGEEEVTREEYISFMDSYIPEGYDVAGRDGYFLTEDNVIAVVEKNTEPAEETTTAAAVAEAYEYTGYMSESTKEAYATVLSNLIATGADTTVVFSFADIDASGDNIPEMIVGNGNQKNSTADIYKIVGDDAIWLCSLGSYGVAGWNEGILVGEYSGSGAVYHYIYELDGDKAEEIHTICAYSDDVTADTENMEATGFTIDGEDATEEEYNEIYAEYITDSLVYNTADGLSGTAAYGYACTEDNIAAVLSVG